LPIDDSGRGDAIADVDDDAGVEVCERFSSFACSVINKNNVVNVEVAKRPRPSS